MAIQTYKMALNQAAFPLVSTWAERSVIVPGIDANQRTPRPFQGSEENIDFNVPRILYGENFVPVSSGIRSVHYYQKIAGISSTAFDQIFPLRDSEENTVLFSPAAGANYVYKEGAWTSSSVSSLLTAAGYVIDSSSPNTEATAAVSRAYVDGKTLVCYSKLGVRLTSEAAGTATADGSLFYWDETNKALVSVLHTDVAGIIANLEITPGDITCISASNGYLLIAAGLTVYWAPYSGTGFDFTIYADGEVTGAGNQIPEDVKGPITAMVAVSGGFIIFTNKNAVAAFYNANNFASPWIFRQISNAGGVESFEQVTDDANLSAVYAYTTGGLQRITLNTAESGFPDVTDFLGMKLIERFNTDDLSFDRGALTVDFHVKLTFCGQRFMVVSYGTYPGIYSFALVYDSELKRWGKLRIVHRDCFAYQYGTSTEDLTYAMLGDVAYTAFDDIAYDAAIVTSLPVTYPRQAISFLLETGEVKIAVMDFREKVDDSEAFVILGKFQLNRARFCQLHGVEIEGLTSTAGVNVLASENGRTWDRSEAGVALEVADDYVEYDFDLVTAKNVGLYINGAFQLSSVVVTLGHDGGY